MKEKITDELRTLIASIKRWLGLNVEYYTLTVVEKVTILVTTMAVAAVCALVGGIVMVLLSFCLVEVFKLFLPPTLAYLCVAGIYLVLCLVLYLLRKPLIANPVAKFITRLILEKHNEKNSK